MYLIIYYLTLCVFVLASFFTELRLWGVNQWGYFPISARLVLFGVGVLVPVALRFTTVRSEKACHFSSERDRFPFYPVVAVSIILVFTLAFYLLRGRMHFLGDGYALLANLSSNDFLIKPRNLGEMLVRLAIFTVLGGDRADRALLSCQISSWVGGVLFLAITFRLAAAVFERNKERLLFGLGLASGGYMLLFFGYVEDYSLFVPTTAVFGIVGVLVATGKCRSWLILVPLALALSFHVFGVTLIPAAAYLLISNSPLGMRFARVRPAAKALIALAVVAAAAIVFCYYYSHSYFFRFSIVPFREGRFTVAGYTLFSVKHLLDYGNLLIILFPAAPLVAVSLRSVWQKDVLVRRDYVFLFVLLLSTLGAAFIFDPRMGMPRDWDLFSFCGGPLAVAGFYLVLGNSHLVRSAGSVAVLSIMLGLLSLAPRVIGQVIPRIALEQVQDYVRFDSQKNAFTHKIIQDYYRDTGDLAGFARQGELWQSQVPESQAAEKGIELKNQGRCPEAIAYFRRAIESNPMYAPAYYDLGSCFLALNNYDSALVYLQIAAGLNPVHDQTRNELRYAYVALGKYVEAEGAWKDLAADGKKNRQAFLNLLELYRITDQQSEYLKLLDQVAAWEDAPAIVFKKRGDYFFGKGRLNEASTDYRTAISRGLDSAEVEDILNKLPDAARR